MALVYRGMKAGLSMDVERARSGREFGVGLCRYGATVAAIVRRVLGGDAREGIEHPSIWRSGMSQEQ